MTTEKFNIFKFTGKMKILHLSWMAFFISFLVWFNFAPLLQAVKETLGLTTDQVKTLLILNVALTIPARVIIGMLTDKYGPRLVYSALLAVCSIPCFMFAFADSFVQAAIARFLLGFIGAGFVIGIRMVSEWFPHNELGTAEGIYGGWGNFGSAAAAFTLPTIAVLFGGEDGWRYAIGLTGVISLVFAFVYYANVTNTPKGSTYFKPKNLGAMEVTSKGDFFLLLLMKLPMYAAIALLAWKLSPSGVDILSQTIVNSIYVGLFVLYLLEVYKVWQVNKEIFSKEVPELHRYNFKQVAVLDILYFTNFGSELAVVSMLPLFFAETFSLDPVLAGLVAGAYAFMNLMSRPAGGWISDKFGRKSTLMILTAGLAAGYALMGMVDGTWPLWLAVVIAMGCSFFVQSGEGAVFAVVPLIKRRMTGQIAGMTGAYGNVGAVTFLTILSFVNYSTFFYVIAATALVGLFTLIFMDEPRGQIAEVAEDGTVHMIDVS
ncbi:MULTISPECIES: NarK family nitrate/nitrite MFS transporter [Marisediminitalea]|jgi:NNP family nitrate/nitrite transporter-like MFS transporter|uniref:NarK family nitrate/nitrite MFS transporter n=1 Tax=Marisediminitalea TaxID=2662254 RepID=UPI0020CDDC3D|nr:NarK family nitrate/nitrite MFS transporter [Marisediminitalea aggregata]MCP3863834.1 NarK family nitrate/nitrite MFS transporter [Aestuariibacter sp.]MCP4234606.1 NarK family nitrate/nitrite MFS transporter [Aestuariibacter sp.]MCP4527418.1 NarK family nitrate/nitrite MFS transporter [Aestuariibacter sp.]MCP4947506.1 NarK family nitrate/nitrite MFS transporter [Aestuariibacter sp.]MCP5012041.1 NarK family nitrate/nitrite MFS transporter [Aestuariibacter sp.]